MTPTKEQVELYIKSADLELGPSSEDAWVEWCRDALRKALQPEAAALTLLDEAIQELGKHYAPKDVIATKEGMDGWNGAVGYCIGTLLRMQDDRRGPQEKR
jgi:hypothetical protein